MTQRTPFNITTFDVQNLASTGGRKVLILAELGATGTGTVDVLQRIGSRAAGRALFGFTSGVPESFGAAAVDKFFARADSNQTLRELDLWAMPLDPTGWAANTWALTFAGTLTAAGTHVLRAGSYSISVAQVNGADPSAQAAAMNSAINTAQIPFTSSVLLAVLTITSDFVGLSTKRLPLTVNLYKSLGSEPEPPGATAVAVVNNADGSGEPAALSVAQSDALVKDAEIAWLLHGNHGALFLDSLEQLVKDGWAGRNARTVTITALSENTEATVTALTGGRQSEVTVWLAMADAPSNELDATVALLDAIKAEQTRQDMINASMVEMAIPGLARGTIVFDPEEVLQAQAIPLRWSSGTAVTVRTVTNRDEDTATTEDLRLYDLNAMLGLRHMLEDIQAILDAASTKVRAANGVTLKAGMISTASVTATVRTQMVVFRNDGFLDADSEEEAKATLLSIEDRTEGGIFVGWNLQLAAKQTRIPTNSTAVITITG